MLVALSWAAMSPRQIMEPQLGSRLPGGGGALQEGCVAKRREPVTSIHLLFHIVLDCVSIMNTGVPFGQRGQGGP